MFEVPALSGMAGTTRMADIPLPDWYCRADTEPRRPRCGRPLPRGLEPARRGALVAASAVRSGSAPRAAPPRHLPVGPTHA